MWVDLGPYTLALAAALVRNDYGSSATNCSRIEVVNGVAISKD
jgi:hypothetical protein